MEDKPDPIDAYVGKRLRFARNMRGLSQGYLGSYIGVQFQQIQKYEKGINRVSAANLAHFARLLGVEVSFFYQGMPQEYLQEGKPIVPAQPDLSGILSDPETTDLIEAYYAVKRRKHRDTVRAVLRAMAAEQATDLNN